MYSDSPSTVVSMEKAIVDPYWLNSQWVKNSIEEESNRRPGYYGFRMQFPATYNREFYTTSDQDRQTWISNIRDMTEVRKIEDYYDIRELIGTGNFAKVYRVWYYW